MQLSTIAELRGNIREAYQLVEYGQLPAAVEVLGRAIEVLRKSDFRWNIHNKKSNLLLEVFVWIGDLYIFYLKSITKFSWLYVLSALTFFILFRMCIYVSHLFWGFYCIMIWADWEIHLHVYIFVESLWFDLNMIRFAHGTQVYTRPEQSVTYRWGNTTKLLVTFAPPPRYVVTIGQPSWKWANSTTN